MKHFTTQLTATAALVALAGAQEPNRQIALVGARILTADGPTIEKGAVVIEGGRIRAVVSDLSKFSSDGLDTVDVEGKWITPGLIDAGTTLGLASQDRNEDGDEVVPHLSVLDALDPTDRRFARVLRRGVTTVQVNPGTRSVIGGRGAVVRTAGDTVAEMVVLRESGLRLTLGKEPTSNNLTPRFGVPTSIFYRRPTTRMGVIATARKSFYDAQEYRETLGTVGDEARPQPDPAMETLVRALAGEITIRSTARSEADIRTALRLAREFEYPTLIEDAVEAWRVIDELREAGSTVLMSAPSSPVVQGEGRADGAEPRWSTLKLLAEAGIPFAICTGTNLASLDLVFEAMFAVRYGVAPETALASITTTPAKILGIEDRVGRVATGLDADLVVWSGNPFAATTRAESVYIRGERRIPE